jgi:voltage-gated potassium channel
MSFIDPENLLVSRMLKVLLCVVLLVVSGTVGYCIIEDWSVADSFYMTLITISTVGYGETNPLSPEGRAFTSLLIPACLITMTGWTAVLTSFMVEGELSGYFSQRKTNRMIASLKNHTIVCGSGPIAAAVIERLIRQRLQVVVIDDNEEHLVSLRKRFRRLLVVEGKGSDELQLAKANVLDARNVVAAMESELDNLLIGITCRDMGGDICVIAKSNDRTIANRMRKAGVNEVISPDQLSGERVCELIAT